MGVAIIASANFIGSNIFSAKKGQLSKKKNSFFLQKLRHLPKTGGLHTRGVAHEVVRSFGDTLRPIECTTCSLCTGTAVKNKYKQKTFAGRRKSRLKVKFAQSCSTVHLGPYLDIKHCALLAPFRRVDDGCDV